MELNLTISSLQDGGHKITKTRKGMVRIFSQSPKPLSAKEIEKLLLRSGLAVNKTTIYRELKFLLSSGYLTEVYLYPKQVSYEPSKLVHHHHLVCNHCGKIDNITNCLARDLEKEIYNKKGFKINRHTLEFYGLCSNCLNRN